MAFYYGLPQEQWDLLVMQAEDLFYDEQIGQHLVGIYPSGPRIFGLESAPPGLLCLYVDDIHNLLNPIHTSLGFYKHKIGNQLYPVIYADFYAWVRWILITQSPDWRAHELLDILPCNQLSIHEDDNITPIIDLVTEFLDASNYITCNPGSDDLAMRTLLILKLSQVFIPNINPQWDRVFSLYDLPIKVPDEIIRLDNLVCTSYLENTAFPKEYSNYKLWLYRQNIELNKEEKIIQPNKDRIEKIGKECVKLFSSQI